MGVPKYLARAVAIRSSTFIRMSCDFESFLVRFFLGDFRLTVIGTPAWRCLRVAILFCNLRFNFWVLLSFRRDVLRGILFQYHANYFLVGSRRNV